VGFVGNRTECALLMLMRSWGEDYHKVREDHQHDIVKVSGQEQPGGVGWWAAAQLDACAAARHPGPPAAACLPACLPACRGRQG
jgi:hypothetical protein